MPLFHRFGFLPAGLGVVLGSAAAARAQTLSAAISGQPAAWREAAIAPPLEIESRPLTQRQFSEAAATQIGFVAALRDWRGTLAGEGPFARRDWAGTLGGQKIGLTLGQVAPPQMGRGAGIAARWSALEIGTTAQPAALGDALERFDALWNGSTPAASQAAQFSWLRAHLANSKAADVELSLGRGRRQLTPGTQREGTFGNARARFALPAGWSLSGAFSRAQTEQSDANSWNVEAAGPLSHPWGTARARASWRDVERGYASLTDASAAAGETNGALEIAQDVKRGSLSGGVRIAATRRERDAALLNAGDERERDGARSQAQLKLRLTPNLSVTGSGSARRDAALFVPADAASAYFPAPLGVTQQMAGDVGLEWKFSRALSLALSAGAARDGSEFDGLNQRDATLEENRRALEVRHQSGGADFRVRLAQRARLDALGATIDITQWRIEAARRLVGGVHLKTIVEAARDASSEADAQRIEAQLQLARLARLDARYRTGTLPQGLLSDEWRSAFAAPDASLTRQWSARLNAGSAAQGGGLGLSLEYARGAGSQNDAWRLGVQWK